jgi:hypothetical protein
VPRQTHEAGDDPAELTLTIGLKRYTLRPIPDGWSVACQESGRNERYEVSATRCTCPSYRYPAAPGLLTCKHIRAMTTVGLLRPNPTGLAASNSGGNL